MDFLKGIIYNVRGLWLGVRTPGLLFLGMTRLVVMIFLTLLFAGLIFAYHQDLLALIWAKP